MRESALMRHILILVALICGLGLAASSAQTTPPHPAPAPVRDANGQWVGTNASETGDDINSGEESDMSAEDNPAARAAEEAARIEMLRRNGAAPQPVTLSAKLIDDGPVIPSGLTWRIFSADPELGGDIKLVTRSEQATGVISLPPGEYLAQAAYGFAQTTDTVTVTDAPVARLLILDAGALRLDARITGGLEINASALKFEIFPQGSEDDPRSVIATNVRPGELIHLNAGIYHIVCTYGSVNAVAETDLRVDKGQLTEATLFHDAQQISLRLVSEIGGEAIADVDWTIKDASDAVVYRFAGTFPSAILAKGDYTVLAQRGDAVYNRDFSVVPGAAQEIEVLTSL